jgi:hypothetical protein
MEMLKYIPQTEGIVYAKTLILSAQKSLLNWFHAMTRLALAVLSYLD